LAVSEETRKNKRKKNPRSCSVSTPLTFPKIQITQFPVFSRAKLQTQTKQMEEKTGRINSLLQEVEKLKNDKQSLKAEIASKTEELQHQRHKKSKKDDNHFEIN
jgi:uncharacterized protein YlxW (UPF0749 family)